MNPIEYYKNNPIEFVELVLGVKLLPYQRELIEKYCEKMKGEWSNV